MVTIPDNLTDCVMSKCKDFVLYNLLLQYMHIQNVDPKLLTGDLMNIMFQNLAGSPLPDAYPKAECTPWKSTGPLRKCPESYQPHSKLIANLVDLPFTYFFLNKKKAVFRK